MSDEALTPQQVAELTPLVDAYQTAWVTHRVTGDLEDKAREIDAWFDIRQWMDARDMWKFGAGLGVNGPATRAARLLGREVTDVDFD